MPEESSTWVALYRGTGGAGRGGRGGRGGGRAGGPLILPPATPAANMLGAAPPATATPPAAAGQWPQAQGAEPESREAAAGARSRRKDPGSDPDPRNLVTGQDVTIPLVTDFEWTRDASWIAYGVSSPKADEDGAFARQMGDGAVCTLLEGQGQLQGLRVRRRRQAARLPQRPGRVRQGRRPVPPHYWKTGDASATELVAGTTRGMPADMVVSDQGAPAFSKDGQRLFLGTAPPPPPQRRRAPEPRASTCGPGKIRWSSRCSACAPSRSAPASYRAVVPPRRQAVRPARAPPTCRPSRPATIPPARSASTIFPTARKPPGTRTTRRVPPRSQDRPAGRILEHCGTGAPMTVSPGGKFCSTSTSPRTTGSRIVSPMACGSTSPRSWS